METRYYTIQDIKKMEGCGKDAAYALAKTLLYEKRGNTIYVFKDSYEEYYKQKLEKAKELLCKINKFYIEKLDLKLNSKTNIFPLKQGIKFCGYTIKIGNVRINKRGKKSISFLATVTITPKFVMT